MACEVPVICSNAGGLPEVVDHGINGYLADVGDVETMANYAIELLKNDQTLKEFGKQALAKAKQFSLDNIINEYLAVYESTLNVKL
jgi:glycosyltransferase involved in cell wall biosynthesis